MSNAFISYSGHSPLDAKIALRFAERLSPQHQVFIQTRILPGSSWPDMVDEGLRKADFMILVLSTSAASSDMVIEEVRRAVRLKEAHGKPILLPVRLGNVDMPYDLAAKVNRIQHLKWSADGDEDAIAERLLAILAGAEEPADEVDALPKTQALSADGAPAASHNHAAPLPAFDPSWLKSLDAQGGAVRLDSPFYVVRNHDNVCRQRIQGDGKTLLISGARQSGKSSLLARLFQAAKDAGIRAVYIDFQAFAQPQLASLDVLLLAIANQLYDDLSLNEEPAIAWKPHRTAQQNLTRYLQQQLAGQQPSKLLLLMDEVDRLFAFPALRDDFFALVRYWHEQRAVNVPMTLLNLALAYSTEASMFIKNENQSPFNVGERFELGDFSREQLVALDIRHGSPIANAGEVDQFMDLLGGHPYLVRKALYELVTGQLSAVQLRATATAEDGPFGDHLKHYMLQFHGAGDLRPAMREVLQNSRCPDDLSFYRLRSAGLVRGPDRLHAAARCGLYGAYFGAHL